MHATQPTMIVSRSMRCLLVGMMAIPGTAAGQESSALSGAVNMIFALGLVLLIIVGLAWVMRRTQSAVLGRTSPLRMVGTLAVGPRERIVVVEISSTWLVVGVAPGRVQSIATVEKGTMPVESAAGSSESFAARMKRAVGGASAR